MKNKLIYFLLISIMASSFAFSQSQKRELVKTNLELFSIYGVMKAHPSKDSINVSLFVNIPNYAIQFVKTDSGFIGYYDMQMSIFNKSGKQTHQYLWSESVTTDIYTQTMSREEGQLFNKSVVLPLSKFTIKVEIMDRDTRKRARKDLEFEPELHTSGNLAVFPSVMLYKTKGNWGFGGEYLPVLNDVVGYKVDSIAVFVTGWAEDGYAKINLSNNNDSETPWRLTDSVAVKNGYFVYQKNISTEKLKGLKNSIFTRVSQNGKNVNDMQEITLRRQGLSVFVNDIPLALDQMKYILTYKEKSELINTSRKEKEELFNKFWAERDPTPETPFNELMEEYYRRVALTNEYFSSFQPGWETDMGLVYILMGPPEDRERRSGVNSRIIEETWYYFRINQSFTFRDRDGFGDFVLTTPFIY